MAALRYLFQFLVARLLCHLQIDPFHDFSVTSHSIGWKVLKKTNVEMGCALRMAPQFTKLNIRFALCLRFQILVSFLK